MGGFANVVRSRDHVGDSIYDVPITAEEPHCRRKFKMANDEEGGGYRWLNQYEGTWYVLLRGTLYK